MSEIIATRFQVSGVRTNDDVTKALQALYDVFAEVGAGQATFEITDEAHADLFIKHTPAARLDPAVLQAALAEAGDYRLLGPGETLG